MTRLATMTGMLARLERGGWIERRPDATDRRSVHVHPTGVERFQALYAEDAQRLDEVFESWPADQAEAFARSLEDINRGLEAPPEDDPRGRPRGSR